MFHILICSGGNLAATRNSSFLAILRCHVVVLINFVFQENSLLGHRVNGLRCLSHTRRGVSVVAVILFISLREAHDRLLCTLQFTITSQTFNDTAFPQG